MRWTLFLGSSRMLLYEPAEQQAVKKLGALALPPAIARQWLGQTRFFPHNRLAFRRALAARTDPLTLATLDDIDVFEAVARLVENGRLRVSRPEALAESAADRPLEAVPVPVVDVTPQPEPEAAPPTVSPQAAALRIAAQNATPFCEICQRSVQDEQPV